MFTPVYCWPQAHVCLQPKPLGAPTPVVSLQRADSAAGFPLCCRRPALPSSMRRARGPALRSARVGLRAPCALLQARGATALGCGLARHLSRRPSERGGCAQAELREFRALQGELAPWTAAFRDKHARKPRLADVEGTGAARRCRRFI